MTERYTPPWQAPLPEGLRMVFVLDDREVLDDVLPKVADNFLVRTFRCSGQEDTFTPGLLRDHPWEYRLGLNDLDRDRIEPYLYLIASGMSHHRHALAASTCTAITGPTSSMLSLVSDVFQRMRSKRLPSAGSDFEQLVFGPDWDNLWSPTAPREPSFRGRHVAKTPKTPRSALVQVRAAGELHEIRRARAALEASRSGMSQREIAELLGTSQANVHRILRRARADDTGQTASVREWILQYVVGDLSRSELVAALNGLDEGVHQEEHPDAYAPGELDHVREAFLDGFIEEDVYNAILRASKSQRVTQGEQREPKGSRQESGVGWPQ